jgi:phosphate transport system protein
MSLYSITSANIAETEKGSENMFRLLFDLWQTQNNLKIILNDFVEMLEMDSRMFSIVLDVFKGDKERIDIHEDVYKRDVEINRRERSIRKSILEHLTVHPGGDLPAGLVLMSIVKDAERVGDYSKNIVEVAQALNTPTKDLRYYNEFLEISNHVTEILQNTIKAIRESDAALAKEIVQDESAMTRRCDALVEKIANSDLSSNEAVCTAMAIRFLKRIEAHLSNIASSVVLPLHRLDGRLEYKSRTNKNSE